MANRDATLATRFAHWGAERKQLDDQLSVLFCCRNAIAPIACLPWELINHIFLETRDSWAGWEAVYPAILRVCRSWRTQALGYGPLWTKINVTDLDTAKELVVRTSSISLDLSLYSTPTVRTREACFQFAMKLFPRAHSFTSVGIDHFDRDATTRALWPSSAQNLECLSLMAPSLRYTLPLELTETATPRLHTLRLTACQADWKMIGPLPLLKVLDLYYITDRLTGGHAPPMPDLLNALRQMPLLETFAYHTHSSLTHLKHMLVRNEEGIRDFQGPEEPEEGGSTHELVGLQDVSLPQLRDLYISSTLARTVAIVKHIPQPRDTLRIEIPCFLREAPAELLGLIGQFGQHLDKQGHSLTTACMSTVPLHPHIVTFAFWDSPQAVHLDARLRVTGELRTVGTHRQSLGPLLGTTLPLKEVETLFVDSLDVVYADEFKMFQLHMPRCTTICINSKQINNSLPAISKDQFCVQGQRLFLKSLERFVLYNFSPDYLQKTSRKPHLLTWNSVVLGLRSLPRELSVVVAGSSSEGKSKLKPLRSAFENFEYVDLPHREDDIAQREGGLRGRIAQHSGVVDMSKFLDMLNILP